MAEYKFWPIDRDTIVVRAPKDGFLLHTSKTLFRLFRLLAALWNLYLFGRHPRGTWAFQNYQGFSIIFSKVLNAFNVSRKWEFFWFLVSLSHFMIRKFCFLFSTKNRLTWEWKNFQKIIADFLDEPGKLHMNRTVISKFFSRPQVKENSRQYLLLWTDILQKTVVGCPCTILSICTAPLDTKLGPAVTVT